MNIKWKKTPFNKNKNNKNNNNNNNEHVMIVCQVKIIT